MAPLVARRLAFGACTLLLATFAVFIICAINPESAATDALGAFASNEQKRLWIAGNGYDRPAILRYVAWLAQVAAGDLGQSRVFQAPVADLILSRLANTAILMAGFFIVVVPLSFGAGILAGMREGSTMDQAISIASVVATSMPPFTTAVFLSLVFVFSLGLLPGTSAMMDGFSIKELILPVTVLVIFDGGYLLRIVRASMVEVMRAPFIRAARLKGLPHSRIMIRHAARNALVAPVTILFAHVNWLISGIVVVEYFFSFKGFGSLILQASLTSDLNLLAGCTLVTFAFAFITQTLADVSYAALDPRTRIA